MAIESKRVVAILLAAGRSERFGGDKLAATFKGRPLAHHSAHTLSSIDFVRRIVVLGRSSVDVSQFGFDIVRPPAGSSMSASIATGVRVAEATDCDACLIALADMPLIPEHHFRALLQTFNTDVVATRTEDRKMVPALFGKPLFARLCAFGGDRGASAMLRHATSVAIHPAMIRDIDVPLDIEKLQSD